MIFVLANLLVSALAGPNLRSLDVSATFNIFTIEWKPTMCMTTSCPSGYLSDNFNVHGLWPSTASGTQPSYCSSTNPFTVSSTVQAQLTTCWLSDSGTPTSFWEHEWEKHGVCMNPQVTANQYFTDGVTLFNQINALAALAAKGISPSNSNLVSKTTFISAFSNKINISCFQSSGNYYLENIQFCYDNNLKAIDCVTGYTNCGTSFYLPA